MRCDDSWYNDFLAECRQGKLTMENYCFSMAFRRSNLQDLLAATVIRTSFPTRSWALTEDHGKLPFYRTGASPPKSVRNAALKGAEDTGFSPMQTSCRPSSSETPTAAPPHCTRSTCQDNLLRTSAPESTPGRRTFSCHGAMPGTSPCTREIEISSRRSCKPNCFLGCADTTKKQGTSRASTRWQWGCLFD